MFLLQKGLDVNHQNVVGVTPLMTAVANPEPQIARLLLIQGANVHAEDQNGRDALKLAVRVSDEPLVVKALLAAGADPYKKDKAGQTAFSLAEMNPNRQIAGVLTQWLNERKGLPKQSPPPAK
jgi:ankyrin repeat protein